jgi:hypothetical protein
MDRASFNTNLDSIVVQILTSSIFALEIFDWMSYFLGINYVDRWVKGLNGVGGLQSLFDNLKFNIIGTDWDKLTWQAQ